MEKMSRVAGLAALPLLWILSVHPALADGNLNKVKHIIVVVQENHSFDNYLGALAYAPGTPYHNGNGTCSTSDSKCVNGLTCTLSGSTLNCTNSNLNNEGGTVFATHSNTRCITDPDHSWYGEHLDLNFENPNNALSDTLDDGYERDDEPINGDQVMNFYTQDDLPWYYSLGATFAISDTHFAGMVGPTFPNRSYLEAATSFGHLTTADAVPPPGGYLPINGTIYDLLNSHGVSWADYFQDTPSDVFFDEIDLVHNLPLSTFYSQAAGNGTLPSVVFVDPNFGVLGNSSENDEHPPTDIQRGQYFVSQVVNAVRNGPYWNNSIILITWDEGGGFYDHALPPAAVQNGKRTPDGVYPGQCEDLSLPPLSELPGFGAECSWNFTSTTDTTLLDAEQLCPSLSNNPFGSYPSSCAAFDQVGIRVPLIAVSPYSKPNHVSHVVSDHTAILRLIEKRFLSSASLTKRDKNASDLEDLFNFNTSPSLNASVGTATPPQDDCTPAGLSGAFGQTLRPIMEREKE